MKVKTITCHRVYNHGASLQEYALLKYLKSLGHDAEAINYTPDYLSNHHNFYNVANPKYDKFFIKWLYLLAKLPQRLTMLKRKKAFDDFENTYIPFTKKNYKDNTDPDSLSLNEKSKIIFPWKIVYFFCVFKSN